MATSPGGDEDTLSVSPLKAAMRRALGNDLSRQKQKTRVKIGSKKYLHLKKFIETRRQKKLEKRCTLDRSAEVMVMVMVMVMESGNGIDNDDDIDGDGDGCGDFFSQIILSNHFHCFSPSMCLTSTEQTWTKHRRRGCQRRRTP
jgi:hypothetical protein